MQANVQGYVWQDNDQNGKYSANIDSGFEGIVVNLYRAVGSALTFLGCANTDATGTPHNPCRMCLTASIRLQLSLPDHDLLRCAPFTGIRGYLS